MRIENSTSKCSERDRAEPFHVPSQEHDIDPMLLQRSTDGSVQQLGSGMCPAGEMSGVNACDARSSERSRVAVVADHRSNLSWKRTRTARTQHGLQRGPFVGCENANLHRGLSLVRPAYTSNARRAARSEDHGTLVPVATPAKNAAKCRHHVNPQTTPAQATQHQTNVMLHSRA
jgi:hypothetical protein